MYTYRFRIYPNNDQKELLEKHFGSCRYIYNYFLDKRISNWKLNQKSRNYYDDANELTQLKKTLPWLKEVNSQSLQASLKNLDGAYSNFFSKRGGFPKFKSKRNEQRFRVPQNIKLKDNRLVVPKFKDGIKTVIHREILGKIKFATVGKNAAGQYYVSITTDYEKGKFSPIKKEIGIDLGLRIIITTSDGDKYSPPKFFRRSEDKIARLNQVLSRKVKGSNNYKKIKQKLAKAHLKVKNQRQDFIHKLTTKLIRENQTIYMETLDVQQMAQKFNLGKSVCDASLGEIIRQFLYKGLWYGRNILQLSQWFPSSKMCSVCGNINQELKLSDEQWTCLNCQTEHDRDFNSSKNILAVGTTVYA